MDSLTQLWLICEERTSAEKPPSSDCPVCKPMGHFPDWWLMWEGPAYFAWMLSLGRWYRLRKEVDWARQWGCKLVRSLASASFPTSWFLPWVHVLTFHHDGLQTVRWNEPFLHWVALIVVFATEPERKLGFFLNKVQGRMFKDNPTETGPDGTGQ